MASTCSYCPGSKGVTLTVCNCKANCEDCLKAKLLYKTALDILHYQADQLPAPEKDKINKKRKKNSPRKLPSSEGSPLKSGRLQRNKKIPIDDDPDFIPDLPEKAEQKNKEDIQDKTFYCYRRMQDLDAKCCKQCEKTKLTSNECKH
jgi:hypothetical protein